MASGVRFPRRPFVIAALLFGGAIALYVITLAPSVAVLFDDSLEFQLVAYELGIAHPTGYPLFTLLGWLFTWLPFGDVAYRVNLLSAFCGAGTVALTYLIGRQLVSDPRHGDTAGPWSVEVGAVLGAIALATSPVFWSQATLAEVYTLNALLVAAILWGLLRMGALAGDQFGIDNAQVENGEGFSPRQRAVNRLSLFVAFLFGLGLAHHRTILLLLPVAALLGWRVRREISVRPWLLLLAFAAPLWLYLYLPMRAYIGSLDGSYSNSLGGFLRHVTASGYGAFILGNPLSVARGASFYLDLFVGQFGWPGILAGLVGLSVLSRRYLATGVTEITFAIYGVFNVFYQVADIEVFFIPLFIIWAVWLGRGAGWLVVHTGSWAHQSSDRVLSAGRKSLGHVMAVVIVLVLLGQTALVFANNLPQRDRPHDWTVHDYGMDIMSQPLEPGAAIVGIQGEITLIRYLQSTLNIRTDLHPVAVDQPGRRLTVVTHLLDQGYAVYLTRELAGAPERWSLSALGPLIRVRPQPDRAPPPDVTMLNVPITPQIALHGYTATRPPSHASLPPLRYNLVWHLLVRTTLDLKVSVRLLAPDGQPVAQADAVPVRFAYPTTAWRAGEFVTDAYDLQLPDRLADGSYTPLVILYDPARGAAEVGRLMLPAIYLP